MIIGPPPKFHGTRDNLLEPLVRANLAQNEPWLVPADSATVCAHFTLLGPFVPERDVDDRLLADLAGFFAAERPFTFELVDVRSFPGGMAYLAPGTPEPFRDLTTRLARLYPAWPPYGGAFDEVVPHVSLGAVDVVDVRVALGGSLPMRACADEAHLTSWSRTSVRTLARFQLGTAAPE